MQSLKRDSIYVFVAAKINKPLAYKTGSLTAIPKAGTIVRVPLAGRTVTGIVVDSKVVADHNQIDKNNSTIKLKTISSVLSSAISVSTELVSLLIWCDRYYHTPIGQVISAALPKSILTGKPAEAKDNRAWTTALDNKTINTISAPKQKALLQWLKEHEPSHTKEIIAAGFGRHLIAALQKKTFIEPADLYSIELNGSIYDSSAILKETIQILKPEQANAVDKICNNHKEGKTQPFYLLDGITGSGKTEVYLQVAEFHLRQKEKVLVLVPEIGLIEQTVKRFRDRFNIEVLTYHSNTPESAKIECWKKVSQNDPIIVVGTRSSIFLPFSDLSLIVVDEEQDLSYKQHEGFRYSARDLAVVRATKHKATLILGSATPSLESLNNVNRGLFQALHLKNRIGNRPLPDWQFCKPASRANNNVLSNTAIEAIHNQLSLGNQVLVFINRRGFAPLLQCTHCGWQAKCNACDISMTLHRQPSGLICHRCDSRQATPQKCPDCKSSHLKPQGLGTEQIESFLQTRFSTTPCIRIDRDSTQRKGSFAEKLAQLQENKPAILIGTQMITKGHHLPGISLVAVLEADSALLSHDFRSIEHLTQSLTQVAGRAGRGKTSGTILIETSQPDHPVFNALATSTYQEFSKQLLESRKDQNLPPFHFSSLIHASSVDLSLLHQFMEHCRQLLVQQGFNPSKNGKIEFIGPMPSPVEKRNNRFRYQIQIYSHSRSQLHSTISIVEQMVGSMKGFGKIRFGIDIDPLTMD